MTSVNTGIRLFFIRQPIVVEKVSAGVIISESLGKSNDSIPRYKAEDPELTYKQCFFANIATPFLICPYLFFSKGIDISPFVSF